MASVMKGGPLWTVEDRIEALEDRAHFPTKTGECGCEGCDLVFQRLFAAVNECRRQLGLPPVDGLPGAGKE